MGVYTAPDTNIPVPSNSFVGTLGPNASFVGQWVDVSDFTSITVSAVAAVAPNATDAIKIDWSPDGGVTLYRPTTSGSNTATNQTISATIEARFARVTYHTGSFGSININVQTLLRKGTIAGSVTEVGFITGRPAAQIVNGVQFGKNANGNFVVLGASTSGNLIVEPPARSASVISIVTPASLASVQIDFAGVGAPTRRWMDIFNNTVRGNLYIRLGSAASLSNYQYKIPPQHTWNMPLSWPVYGNTGATVFGIWDVADGECRTTEGI